MGAMGSVLGGGLNAVGMGGADVGGGGGAGIDPNAFDPSAGIGGDLSGGTGSMDPGAFDSTGGFADAFSGVTDPTGAGGASQAFSGGPQGALQATPGSIASQAGDQPGAAAPGTGQPTNPQNPQHPDQPSIPDIIKAFEHGPDSITSTPGAGSITGSQYDTGGQGDQGATRGLTRAPPPPSPSPNVPTPQPRLATAPQNYGPSGGVPRLPQPPPPAPTPQPRPPTAPQADVTSGAGTTPPTSTASAGSMLPPGTGADTSGAMAGGGGAPQSPLEQLLQGFGGRGGSPLEQLLQGFMHILGIGSQGGLGPLGMMLNPMEKLLAHALGIPLPPGMGGNPLNRPVGPGYYPPGTVGGTSPRGAQVPPQGPAPGLGASEAAPGAARHSPGSPGASGSYNPQSYMHSLIQIESSGNPNKITGSNYGLGQFSPDQWHHFGITAQNWRDPQVQMRAIQQEANENIPKMRSALGRDPTSAELYLAHQQNVPEAIALIKSNPNTPAWQVVRPFYSHYRNPDQAALSAIHGNNLMKQIPASQMTAGQFVDMWNARFNRGLQ